MQCKECTHYNLERVHKSKNRLEFNVQPFSNLGSPFSVSAPEEKETYDLTMMLDLCAHLDYQAKLSILFSETKAR